MNIWVPKLKILEPNSLLEGRVGVAGFFKLERVNPYGRVLDALEWKQLITNTGLDQLAVGGGIHDSCSVGTGTASPSFTDTALQTLVGSTTSQQASSVTVQTAGPQYYRDWTMTKQFGLGAIVANLTEVGFGNNSSSLCFRDLIRDSGGSPTTFPVTAADQLRVTHTIRVYPPMTDSTGTFVVGGSAGSGSHDFIARAAGVSQTGSTPWSDFGGYANAGGLSIWTDGTVGSVTGNPSGAQQTMLAAPSYSSYINGSFYRDATYTLGLSSYNFASGVGAFWDTRNYGGSFGNPYFQYAFNPKIPKFAGSIERILTITVRNSVARV